VRAEVNMSATRPPNAQGPISCTLCGNPCKRSPCHACRARTQCPVCAVEVPGGKGGWCMTCLMLQVSGRSQGQHPSYSPEVRALLDERIALYQERAERGLPLFG
jgi:hypothetical protein